MKASLQKWREAFSDCRCRPLGLPTHRAMASLATSTPRQFCVGEGRCALPQWQSSLGACSVTDKPLVGTGLCACLFVDKRLRSVGRRGSLPLQRFVGHLSVIEVPVRQIEYGNRAVSKFAYRPELDCFNTLDTTRRGRPLCLPGQRFAFVRSGQAWKPAPTKLCSSSVFCTQKKPPDVNHQRAFRNLLTQENPT